jgi:hypothetical protein
MPLTDIACRSRKPSPKLKKLSDMGGLQLWVFPNGSKLWRFAYRFGGKQKLLALGRYPDTTLVAARAEREKAKALLKERREPRSRTPRRSARSCAPSTASPARISADSRPPRVCKSMGSWANCTSMPLS